MTSTPPNTTPAPVLSLLVLLPQAAHIPDLAPQPTSSSRTLARPSPLTSRQSQGHVPSLGSLSKIAPEPAQDAGESEIDKMISAGRRMSLAPGIGGGTQTKSPTTAFASKLSVINSSPQSDQEDFEAYTYPSPGPSAPSTPAPPAPPAFGSSRGGVRPSRNRRPATATLGSSGLSPMAMGMTNAGSSSGVGQGGMSRASISGRGLGRISGIGGSLGKTRPGWEGDEVVGVLRSSGMEVTVVRNASQIPSVLSPTSTSTPSFGSLDQQSNFPGSRSSPSSSRPFTPVILVPLSDILTIPSLSLLLQQGTTPTAVCFQQDLLERARKTEEEWLPHALDQIRSVVEMRDRGLMTHDNSGLPPVSETPVILAYSANPALSSSTIAACVGVGAAGVLKPPYDLETSRLVRRMVRAAREGRVSSVVGLPAYLLPSAMPGHSTPNEVLSEDEEDTRRQVGRVILPPTALSRGGEHEGEKVLSGAFHKQHRRGTSTQWDLGSNMTPSGRSREMSAPYTIQRKHSNPPPGQVAPSTSVQSIITSSSSKSRFSAFSQDERDIDHAERHQLTSLYHYNPTLQQRRRSVDTSGLGLALLRAQRVFEKQQSVPSLLSPAAMSRSHSLGVQDDDDEKSYSANSTPRLGSKAFTPKSAARPHSAVRGLAMGSNASLTRAVDERDDHDHEHRDGDRCKDTELAELLSAMYYQTRLAIDIQMDEYEQFSAPMSPEQRSRLVEYMSTWHFKPHNLDDADLFRCACIMFDGILNIEGLAELQVDRDSLYRLLFAIKAIYHAPNPYHNYVHAIDVLQATYSFLAELELAPPFSYIQQMTPQSAPWKRPADAGSSAKGSGTLRARETFRPQDVLAVLVAAMGHDVGHPGLSNAFMKNAKTPLSQVYEDKSVLENMHCMLVVQLIRKHGFGFLIDPAASTSDNGPQRFDTRGFRNVLYSSILATDMSLHFAWMQSLEDFEGQVSSGLGIYDYKNGTREQGVARDEKVESDRILIAQAIIKCADISNPTRPIDVSEHWSSVLLKEWAVQASLETDLQLPVSVIASADAALQAKGQIGFIKLFTQPLFDAVSRVLPELRNYAEWCSQNRAIWEGRHETMQQDAGDSRIVQPAVEDAAHDERFSTLFPLSLPTSLVALASLEPGPTLADPQGHLAPGYSLSQATPPRTARSTSGVLSPGFNEEGYPGPQVTQSHGPHLGHSDSPSAKAMRAVYHANLLDQRHRLSSWTRGVPIPGIKPSLNHRAYLEIRRSSTPGYLGFAH